MPDLGTYADYMVALVVALGFIRWLMHVIDKDLDELTSLTNKQNGLLEQQNEWLKMVAEHLLENRHTEHD